MADWRDKMIDTIIELTRGSGVVEYDDKKILATIDELAEIDKTKPTKERIGCLYVKESYSDKAKTNLLTKIQRVWNTAPKQLPTATIIPAKDNAKIEVKKQSSTPSNRFQMRCVLAVKLEKTNAKSIEVLESKVLKLLSDKVLDGFTLEGVAFVHDNWFDILVLYSTHLAKIYTTLRELDGVVDTISKPAADYGKKTIATMR